MTSDLILGNAMLVMPDETFSGSVRVRDGMIADIASGPALPKGAVDCLGDFLAPGLVELHTDNLERHIRPRPKVDWPHIAALVAHDRELASAGITTVFDALRVGSIPSDLRSGEGRYARALADELQAARHAGHFKISHRLHLRAEVCSETLVEELNEFGPDDKVGILSLMDHTPGQRQFRDLNKLADYFKGKHGLSDAEFDIQIARLKDLRETVGDRHEFAAVAAAKRYGAVLASHDDTTIEQVDTSHRHGVSLAEFPTTVVAAEASKERGMHTIVGGPNIVRGGSHSGNVSAMDLAKHDLLDILSSDYIPGALLMGAVMLGQMWGNMSRGLATVTANPAASTGLSDRGRLQPGLRADLARFAIHDKTPILRAVWSQGERVA